MAEEVPLSKAMTLRQFDHGYWFATELKGFAKEIGVSSASKLRKDELEKAIRHFLITGEIQNPARRPLSPTGVKDVDQGLALSLPVSLYSNDKETKDFLEREALKAEPSFKRKSGARYRLNRWREEQIYLGISMTYQDLVKEYVRLCQTKGAFQKVPHGRYINFVSDFYAAEEHASKESIAEAWALLKELDTPKTYQSWKAWCLENPPNNEPS